MKRTITTVETQRWDAEKSEWVPESKSTTTVDTSHASVVTIPAGTTSFGVRRSSDGPTYTINVPAHVGTQDELVEALTKLNNQGRLQAIKR